MAARMEPARTRSSRDEQPSAWGWGSGAWGWGADEDNPTDQDNLTDDTEQDPTDG